MILFLLLASLSPQDKPEREAVTVPGEKITFEMVRLPGGKVRDATLRPFRIGTREVTWGEFNAYYEVSEKVAKLDGITRPTKAKSYFGDVGIRDDWLVSARPVTNVRWHGAMGYCDWLSRKTGRYFRLPTEAEWEYAARGDGSQAPLDEIAWHQGNSGKITQPPGAKKPNSFGLYDVLGNVWEYCLELQNPPEFLPVLRGGSWDTPASDVRIDARRTITVDWFDADCVRPRSVWWLGSAKAQQGFRIVCVDGAAAPAERDAYAPKVALKVGDGAEVDLKIEKTVDSYCRVQGEVINGGDRAIDELEIVIYFLTPDGKPHFVDIDIPKSGRATFVTHHPVLGASARGGVVAQPLKPGDKRTFQVHLPMSFAPEGQEVDYGKFGARVTQIRFAKE